MRDTINKTRLVSLDSVGNLQCLLCRSSCYEGRSLNATSLTVLSCTSQRVGHQVGMWQSKRISSWRQRVLTAPICLKFRHLWQV